MAAALIEVHGIDALGARLLGLADAAPRAVLRAVSRTRTTIMARVARIVSQAAGIPVRRVKRSIHGTRPNFADPDVTITLWGVRAKLIDYSRGIQRQTLPPSGFRATAGGHVGLFERRPGRASREHVPTNPPRAISTRIRPGVWHTLPIDEAYGPPFSDFLSGAALAQLLREGGEVFRANLEREIAFRESKRGT